MDIWGIYVQAKQEKSDYYKDSLINDFNNPKQLWNRINSIVNKPTKSSTTHIRVNKEVITDPSLIAIAFSQDFSSVCSSQSFHSPHCDVLLNNSNCSGSFSFRRICPIDVQQVKFM